MGKLWTRNCIIYLQQYNMSPGINSASTLTYFIRSWIVEGIYDKRLNEPFSEIASYLQQHVKVNMNMTYFALSTGLVSFLNSFQTSCFFSVSMFCRKLPSESVNWRGNTDKYKNGMTNLEWCYLLVLGSERFWILNVLGIPHFVAHRV
jgi:hypothetical protein